MNMNWISVMFLAFMAGVSGLAKADTIVVQTACTWQENAGLGGLSYSVRDAPRGCMGAAVDAEISQYDFEKRLQLSSPPDCKSVGGVQVGDKIMLSADADWRTFTVIRQCKVKTL